ncbi:MAG TPA: hypothetical protein VJ327_06525 [Patescibacteria group bacterium]|nr:hypothetical protein [Patescibacteria group bacterium]
MEGWGVVPGDKKLPYALRCLVDKHGAPSLRGAAPSDTPRDIPDISGIAQIRSQL